jgi:hypothetical protein
MARTRRNLEDPQQTLLFADVLPNGTGGFTLVPKKPCREINSEQAAKILGCSRATINRIIDGVKGQKYLRWRWMTEKKGKRIFELDSVIAYKNAMRDEETAF